MSYRATSHRFPQTRRPQGLRGPQGWHCAQGTQAPQAKSIAVPWSEDLGKCSSKLGLSQSEAAESHRRIRTWLWSAFVLLAAFSLMACLWAGTAKGQEFESIPLAEKFDADSVEGMDSPDRSIRDAARQENRNRKSEYNRVRGLCRDIVEGKSPLAGNEADFDLFFREYIFARMTQYNQENLKQLGSLRDELFDFYIERGENQEAYDRLVKTLAFEEMKKIVEGNYHPAVRVNAMAVISRLDGVLGQHRGRAPVPLAEALAYMLQKVGNDATPGYIQATAIAGILRHANIDGQKANESRMAAPVRDQVVSQMVTLLGTEVGDRDPALHQWMERQAIRVLGAMRMPGNSNAAARAVYERLIGEGSLALRSDAAEAYGMIRFANPNEINADEASMKMAELAVEASRYELAYLDGIEQRLADLEKWRASGGQSNEAAAGFNFQQGGEGDPRGGAPGDGGKGGGPPGGGGKGAPAGAPSEGAGGKGGGPGGGAPGGAPGRGGRGAGRGGIAGQIAQGGGGGKGAPGAGGKSGGGSAPAGPPGGENESAGFGGGFGGGGGFGNFGNAGVDMSDPNALPNYVSLLSRRRLKTIMASLQTAVGPDDQTSVGLLSNAGIQDATKQNIVKIRDSLKTIMSATDEGLDGDVEDGKTPNDVYVEALERAANELERVCTTIQGADAAKPFGSPAAAEEGAGLPNN